jgi:mono/diheme cytochrome c family protein
MKSLSVAIAGVAVASLGLAAAGQQARTAPVAAPAPPVVASPAPARPPASVRTAPTPAAAHAPSMTAAQQTELIKTYCASCHSEKAKAGGLSLAGFDVTRAQEHPEVVEKIIRKVRAGMMPPASAKRPDAAVIASFLGSLETRMDEFAASNPNPGWRPFQRLNRAEYQRAVRDLLGIDVDVSTYLPPDTISAGFDNVADVQTFSPALMEGYLRAASSIAALAVGDPNAAPTEYTYKVPRTQSQMEHVEGAPLGTRGGLSAIHVFPADGDYSFRTMLHSIPTGELYGSTVKGEQLEISIDGERVALLDINPRMSESSTNGMNIESDRVHISAGPHRVSAAFLERYGQAPVDDLLAPIDYTLADSQIGSGFGVTTLPHIRDFSISGPFRVTGVSDTVSRRRIFTCRPTSAAEEAPCAEAILRRLAGQAYRGPASAADLAGLIGFYERGRSGGDFETGIATAVEALLASPRFVFRLEQAPPAAKPGQTYRVADLELASRLSFFLWGAVPDAELVKVASSGQLSQPAAFARQVTRMLADPRAEALSTRFASQWLRLQDVDKIRPDALLYPYWDHNLAESLVRETQLLFDSLVRDDRSVLDFFTADYTFVNERVAKHYGIPNITGPQFRRVAVPDERRGILGQGSVQLLTSVADRTSPVQRGKWVMEVLLGTPPPAPPPNVPSLDESVKADKGGKMLSVRERMEQHRANPACNSCHRVIDPLGLALENFDVTGKWRIKDNGVPIDSNGELYDGTKMQGPAGLRTALLKHQDLLLLSFTERLMTYAIGRRMEPYDMPAIRAIIRDAAKNDYKLSSFVMGVANSAAFRTTRMEAVETTDAPAAR